MAKNPVGLAAAASGRCWHEGIRFDFKGLFLGLGKAMVKLKTGDPVGAGLEAANLIKTVGKKHATPEQLARLWILRSLTRAIYELVGRNFGTLQRREGDLKKLCDSLDLSFSEKPVVISRDFLDHPETTTLVRNIQKPLAQWLQGIDLSASAADATCERLGKYFTRALYDEWTRGFSHDERERIRTAIENPITTAAERDWAWDSYHAQLVRDVAEPVFEEPFSLEQIHINLCGYYAVEVGDRKKLRQPVEDPEPSRRKPKSKVVRVKEELQAWLENDKKGEEYRVLSGGPGAGKSSFARMFAADQVRRKDQRWRVLFVALHRINVTTDLQGAIGAYLGNTPLERHNPLEPAARIDRLLLILDGLDEVAEQGKVGADAARSFLREVDNRIEGNIAAGLRRKVLITGRSAAVDPEALPQSRKQGCLIHLAPYFTPKRELEQFENSRLLAKDLRLEWWKRYSRYKGKDTQLIGKLLQNLPPDVTAQPLLLYLTAFGEDQGFDFSGDFNLNELYEFLIKKVYERGWGERKTHAATERVSCNEFIESLEAVAVAAWHGAGRQATLSEVKSSHGGELPPPLRKLLGEETERGLLKLLVAFYLRPSGVEKSDKTFEFTHKSFREYLTARAIVRRVAEIIEDLDDDHRRSRSRYGVKDALADWARLCGPEQIDWDVREFLRREVARQSPEVCAKWQQETCRWIGHVLLRSGMPMEDVREVETHGEKDYWARNSEVALLVTLSTCSQVTQEVSEINWPDEFAAANWFRRLLPQQEVHLWFLRALSFPLFFTRWRFMSKRRPSAIKASIARIVLNECDLESMDFSGANLRSTNFRNASLSEANLTGAALTGADLVGADLAGANLTGADLTGADLAGADLAGADLAGADLTKANLTGANLTGASFSGASGLGQANLTVEQTKYLRAKGYLG